MQPLGVMTLRLRTTGFCCLPLLPPHLLCFLCGDSMWFLCSWSYCHASPPPPWWANPLEPEDKINSFFPKLHHDVLSQQQKSSKYFTGVDFCWIVYHPLFYNWLNHMSHRGAHHFDIALWCFPLQCWAKSIAVLEHLGSGVAICTSLIESRLFTTCSTVMSTLIFVCVITQENVLKT